MPGSLPEAGISGGADSGFYPCEPSALSDLFDASVFLPGAAGVRKLLPPWWFERHFRFPKCLPVNNYFLTTFFWITSIKRLLFFHSIIIIKRDIRYRASICRMFSCEKIRRGVNTMESRSHKAESDGSYPEPKAAYTCICRNDSCKQRIPFVYTAASVDKFPAFCLCAGAGREQLVRFPK